MIHYDPELFTVTHNHPPWSTSIHYDPQASTMIYNYPRDPISSPWSNIHHHPPWSNIIHRDPILSTVIQDYPPWSKIIHHHPPWPTMHDHSQWSNKLQKNLFFDVDLVRHGQCFRVLHCEQAIDEADAFGDTEILAEFRVTAILLKLQHGSLTQADVEELKVWWWTVKLASLYIWVIWEDNE